MEHSLADIEFVSPGRFSILNPDTESEQATRYPEDDPALTPLNEGNAQALLNELVTACRQQLLVFAPEQAAWLFKRRDFISACEALIARNPKAQIRILLQSVEQEFLSGHTPLALAHRFPSLCQVRRQHPDLPLQPHVQVISDDRGFLMLPKARQREGFVRRDSPDQAKRWGDRFNELGKQPNRPGTEEVSTVKSGMLKLLCWMTLSIATLMANAATTEVVPLGYNMAENIIPAIQPMLQSNRRVSAYGNQLLIRAEPQRIDEIKALVAQLDTQPSRLMISVANSGSSSGQQRWLPG
ncbi:secretin N-terminal domain-containing protein [Halopseudomonas pachastrellae]|nr:secretin N-terminal domain-containing protein [Halopseudomonas pachastrellae]